MIGRRAFLLLCGVLSCAPLPTPEAPVRGLSIPVRDPTPRPPDDDDPRESPPEAEPERPFALPAAQRAQLASGTELISVVQKGSPVVELRLVIRGAGSSSEGASPGLAALALRLCLEGGAGRLTSKELTERLAALGPPAAREIRSDAAVLSLSVAREQVSDALSLLIQALREPRQEAADLARIKRLERGARSDRSLPATALTALAWRELLQGPPQEPAARDIDRLTAPELKAFLKQRYTPSALSIVAVGDIDPAALRATVEQASATWKSPPAPAPPAPSLRAPSARQRLLVVDVPGRPSAELLVLAPGPARSSEPWAAAQLLADVLGGASTSRLAVAVQGSPPLATSPRVALREHGSLSLIEAQAAADPARVAAALGAMLDTLRKASEAPTEAEIQGARRRALAAQAQAHAAPPSLADELAHHAALRLPDGASPQLAEQLKAAEPAAIARAGRELLGGNLLVLILGDAAQVASPLTRWGEVTVVSADRLEKLRVLPETAPPSEKK